MAELQIVNFTVGEVHYGVPVEQVREVRDMQAVTPIPGSDASTTGVTNLRGQIIPLMDLRRRLSLETAEGASTKIIVVERLGKPLGILIDSVTEVSTIPGADVEQAADLSTGGSQYLLGVAKQGNRIIVLLDLARFLQERIEASAGVQAEALPC